MIDAYSTSSNDIPKHPAHVNYTNPSVKVISNNNMVPTVYSFSRPNQSYDESLNEVESWVPFSGTSLNEFNRYVLEIHSTFKYKQFLQLFRGISIWSVGKRLVGLSNQSFLSGTSKNVIKGAYDDYDKDHNLRRLYLSLPESLMVTYQIELDYRTLCSLIKTGDLLGYDKYTMLYENSTHIVRRNWDAAGIDMRDLFSLPNEPVGSDTMTMTAACTLFDMDKLITNSRSYIRSNVTDKSSYNYKTVTGMLNDLYVVVIKDDPYSIKTIKDKLDKIRKSNDLTM